MKNIIVAIFLVFFGIQTIAQNVKPKFDVENFPELSVFENNTWEVSKGYKNKKVLGLLKTQTWQAVKVLPLLNKEWEAKGIPSANIVYVPQSENVVLSADNKLILLSDKGRQKDEFTLSAENGSQSITAVSVSRDGKKLAFASAHFDLFCKKKFWEIQVTGTSKFKPEQILATNDQKAGYAFGIQQEACPFISHLCLSPSGKTVAGNYSSAEFEQFCTKLFVLNKSGEIKMIEETCRATLVGVEFVSETELIYALSDNNSDKILLNYISLEGNKLTQKGCFVPSGFPGRLLDFSILEDKPGLLLYYEKDSTTYISEFDFEGNLVSKKEAEKHYRMDLETESVFTAYDYGVLNLRKQDEKDIIGVLWHEADVYDFAFSPLKTKLLTSDEVGTIKKWELQTKDEFLLVLENDEHFISVPVTTTKSVDEIERNMFDTKSAYNRFASQQYKIARNRLILENDYLRVFELNEMPIYSGKPAIDLGNAVKVKFEVDANLSAFDVKVFHVFESDGVYKAAAYPARAVNEFCYSNDGANHLLAILPNGKIAILKTEEFINLIQNSDKSEIINIKLNTFQATKTEDILKTILEK